MKDIFARFLFVIWIIGGVSVIIFGLTGNDMAGVIAGLFFVSPIVIGLLYVLVKWIITGDAE